MSDALESEAILVKRYARSRLYDTFARCHVSVEQLRRWEAEGTVFSGVDTQTGENITRVLLA